MNVLSLVLSYLASAFAFAIAGFSFFSGPGVRDVGGAVVFAVLGALMLFVAVWHNLETIGVIRTPYLPPECQRDSHGDNLGGSFRIHTVSHNRQQPMRPAA